MIPVVRTTAELSPHTHARAKAYAAHYGQSLASAIGDLTAYALQQAMPEEPDIRVDPLTGFPYLVMNLGYKVTSEDVARIIQEGEDWDAGIR